MGTPLTMAPEVLDGKPASAGADVYGLGATLFRLLTGRYPVEGASIEEIRRAHRSGERARVRGFAPHVSARLARAVERAIEPDPGESLARRERRSNARSTRRPTRRVAFARAPPMIGAGVAGLAAVSFLAFLVLRPGAGPISRGRLAVPRDANAYHEAWRRSGSEEKSGFGYVGTVVDLDHDGYADVVGVEPHWSGPDKKWRGRMLIFRGGPDGPGQEPSTIIEGDVPGCNAWIPARWVCPTPTATASTTCSCRRKHGWTSRSLSRAFACTRAHPRGNRSCRSGSTRPTASNPGSGAP